MCRLSVGGGSTDWLEGFDFVFLGVVAEGGLHVVYCHAAFLGLEAYVAFLGDELVCSVASAEVE